MRASCLCIVAPSILHAIIYLHFDIHTCVGASARVTQEENQHTGTQYPFVLFLLLFWHWSREFCVVECCPVHMWYLNIVRASRCWQYTDLRRNVVFCVLRGYLPTLHYSWYTPDMLYPLSSCCVHSMICVALSDLPTFVVMVALFGSYSVVWPWFLVVCAASGHGAVGKLITGLILFFWFSYMAWWWFDTCRRSNACGEAGRADVNRTCSWQSQKRFKQKMVPTLQ